MSGTCLAQDRVLGTLTRWNPACRAAMSSGLPQHVAGLLAKPASVECRCESLCALPNSCIHPQTTGCPRSDFPASHYLTGNYSNVVGPFKAQSLALQHFQSQSKPPCPKLLPAMAAKDITLPAFDPLSDLIGVLARCLRYWALSITVTEHRLPANGPPAAGGVRNQPWLPEHPHP